MAGAPPTGTLSNAHVEQGTNGLLVTWDVGDPIGIQEVVIVRKRYMLQHETDVSQPFQNPDEVLAAADRDDNGIPEDDVTIVGRVNVTQTRFEDTTVFEGIDVNSEAFDPNNFHYYYAVVPVDAMGLMGTPSIVPERIIPRVDTTSGAPAFFIHTQPHGTGEWHIEVQSTQPLQAAPHLTVESPNTNNYVVFLKQETDTKWIGTLRTDGFPPTGAYFYKIRGQTPAGITGTRIWQGQIFNYIARLAQIEMSQSHRTHFMRGKANTLPSIQRA